MLGEPLQCLHTVIGKKPDGSVIIEDTVDGDIWILGWRLRLGMKFLKMLLGGATRGDGDIKTGKVEEANDWYWDPIGQVWNLFMTEHLYQFWC
ncbi:MAG: hypothetical protein CM15mV72_310 [uncultured marine virus]|nr:MAG: hypothetical protein CM15mV72_310 [uncultured marine virus]